MIILAIYIIYFENKSVDKSINENAIKLNLNKNIIMGITNFDTINPILSKNRDIQFVDKLVFKPLLDITYDFKIKNSLAEEFSKINDYTYIVKLKENVYWHEGTKFNADDVIFTIDSLKKDNVESIYKENVKNIKEIQKIDEYTIKIILNEEVPFFEYKMCFPIISKDLYDENSLEAKTSYPIGTGEYKIATLNEEEIILQKNEQKLHIIIKDNIRDLYNAFNKNEIDFMITENLEYEEYIGTMGYNVQIIPYRNFEFLILNNNNRILKEKSVRQAISYAIDKNKINYNVYKSKYNLVNFPLDYIDNENNKNKYDIEKAKNILSNNIWKRQKGKLKFRLIVNNEDEKRVLIAEEIKKELEEIGITIIIEKVNNKVYNDYIKSKNYDMIIVRKHCIK